MYIKLTCIIGIFINFYFFIIFCVLFLGFFIFSCLTVFLLWPLSLLLRVFVNILYVSCLFFTNSNEYNLSRSVFVHINIDILLILF